MESTIKDFEYVSSIYQKQVTEESNEIKSYIKLYRAVIFQAIADATTTSIKKRNRMVKINAIRWLKGNSSHFKETCINAGLNPEYVRKKAKELIEKSHKLPRK